MIKKISLSILTMFFAVAIFAHPPASISLAYFKNKKLLRVELDHKVRKPENHYIQHILVSVNNRKVSKVDYTSQKEKDSHVAVIRIDAKPGDLIEVEAKCNKIGTGTSKIKVE